MRECNSHKVEVETESEAWADLHIHSNRSDGLFSPEEIVALAAQLGLKAISITDHDDLGAVERAMHQGSQLGVEVIPGIELSARIGNYDIHLLGYFIDYQDENFLSYLEFFKDERLKRARRILERLQQLGIKVEMELVLEKAGCGSVGRPHIADAMVEQGCVFSYQEAFKKYLGDACPAYVPKFKLNPKKAIELINSAGGLSFVAHPGIDITNEGLINLMDCGLEGIETVHPKHTPGQIEWYRKIILKYGLLESGGSDCHGNRKRNILLGKFNVPYEWVKRMKQWKNSQNRSEKTGPVC